MPGVKVKMKVSNTNKSTESTESWTIFFICKCTFFIIIVIFFGGGGGWGGYADKLVSIVDKN